ncbi:MAG: dynamin family protein [Candidatus Sericytochromatia bacterium]
MTYIIEENIKIVCSNCNSTNNVSFNRAQKTDVKCGRCKVILEIPIKNEIELINDYEYSTNYLKEVFQESYNYLEEFIGREKGFQYSDKIRDLEQKISSIKQDEFHLTLVIAGEYSSGKSSFINSLIGEDLLPADFEPITLAPSYLRYGEEKKVILEFKDAIFEEISIEKFSNIKHSNESLEKKYKEDIKFIHIFYPYPKLSQIHIIDTPGFSTSTQKGDDQKTIEIINEYSDLLLWVFDADNGTAKESEIKIIDKIKNNIEKNNSFLDSIINNTKKPIIGIVNKIDLKGKPDSESVKKILDEVKKNSGIEIIIPYSSKKISDYKNNPPMTKISSIIEDNIKNRSNITLKLNIKEDDRGNKNLKITNSFTEILSMKIDFGDIWFKQLYLLEKELSKIRFYSKEILKKSIDNEIRISANEILNDLKNVLVEIKNRKLKEKKAFESSINEIKIYSTKIEDIYNEYESDFKYILSKTLAQSIFTIKVNKGIIWDDQKVEIKSIALTEITKIVRNSFDKSKLINLECEKIKSFFSNFLLNVKNDREEYNQVISKIFEPIEDKFCSEISTNLSYLYASNTNAISLSTVGLSFNIIDKYSLIDSKKDSNVIYNDLFSHLYNDCSFNVLFFWLKEFIKNEYISLIDDFEKLEKLFEEENNKEIEYLESIKNKLEG